MKHLDNALVDLGLAQPVQPKAEARKVLSQDGTTRDDAYLTDSTSGAEDFKAYSARVDSLFGDKPAYQGLRKEKPEHRQMLWLRLQGHNVKETALVTGYTPQHVSSVCKQAWFRDAFVKLSAAAGKDAVETYLEGEVIPTLERLVHIRDHGETDAVKKSACDSILDRIRGKPTVKVETKSTGSFQHIVHDAAALMEESRRLDEQLRANGHIIHGTS